MAMPRRPDNERGGFEYEENFANEQYDFNPENKETVSGQKIWQSKGVKIGAGVVAGLIGIGSIIGIANSARSRDGGASEEELIQSVNDTEYEEECVTVPNVLGINQIDYLLGPTDYERINRLVAETDEEYLAMKMQEFEPESTSESLRYLEPLPYDGSMYLLWESDGRLLASNVSETEKGVAILSFFDASSDACFHPSVAYNRPFAVNEAFITDLSNLYDSSIENIQGVEIPELHPEEIKSLLHEKYVEPRDPATFSNKLEGLLVVESTDGFIANEVAVFRYRLSTRHDGSTRVEQYHISDHGIEGSGLAYIIPNLDDEQSDYELILDPELEGDTVSGKKLIGFLGLPEGPGEITVNDTPALSAEKFEELRDVRFYANRLGYVDLWAPYVIKKHIEE